MSMCLIQTDACMCFYNEVLRRPMLKNPADRIPWIGMWVYIIYLYKRCHPALLMGESPENSVLRTQVRSGTPPQNLGDCAHVVQD